MIKLVKMCVLILTALAHPGMMNARGQQQSLREKPVSAKVMAYESTNLPIIVINTNNQAIPDNERIIARMGVINNPGERNYFNGTFNEYDGIISIEQRGSSSAWVSDKKSYSLETQNDTNGNLNVPLLGLPEENDWILVGEYSDKSLIRNGLAYELSRRMGRYASRTRFCELVLNGDYRGIYMLAEKIKRDKNRVNIARLNPDEITGDDLTGGYLLRIDRPDECWASPYLSPAGSKYILISYYDPKGPELAAEQKEYIRQQVTSFEDALNSGSYQDTLLGYYPYVDLNSFTDFFMISELSKNIDAYRLSTYFYKDKDSKGGKITMGPVWDVNLGFGNANYYSGDLTYGWVITSIPSGDDFQIPFWWSKLRQDPRFNTVLKSRWTQFRNTVLADDIIQGIIDSLSYLLDEAQGRNFARWPILNQWVWPNSFVGASYPDEIAFLGSWVGDRLSWMDEQLEYPYYYAVPEINNLAFETTAFPNPFQEELTIRISLCREAGITITCYNSTGETVYRTSESSVPAGTHNFTMHIGEAGLYFYQVACNGIVVKTGKVVRE